MEVQKYIRDNGWEALTSELSIKVDVYHDHGMAKLNYSQFAGPKTHPVVMECRGLILSYPDPSKVIARAFTRFFNLGEAPEITTKCNIANSDVYEKVDGSLVMVYWCPSTNQYEISTRGKAFAEGQCPDHNHATFRSAIVDAFGVSNGEFQDAMRQANPWKSVTHVFEYIGPMNRIVTRYTASGMVLLAVIVNETGERFTGCVLDTDIDAFATQFNMKVRPCKQYSFTSTEELVLAVNSIEGLEEGFVAVDRETGVMVKVKSPKYLTAHRLGNNGHMSHDVAAELVCSGNVDEFLSYFPEHTDIVHSKKIAQLIMLRRGNAIMEDMSGVCEQKKFAEIVKGEPASAVFFLARKSGRMFSDEWYAMPINKKVSILNNFCEEYK